MAASTYDLSNSNNWNIRITGSESYDGAFSDIYSKHFEDINNNGVNDLILCNYNASNQSRSQSGSCYVIYDSILSQYSGIGKIIDLTDPNNFNLRFDGPTVGSMIGYTMGATIADVNGNSKADLLIPASGAYLLNWGSGAFYVIFDDIIDDYTGVGNIIDLANSNNFSIRYDGHTSGGAKNYASEAVLLGTDVNNNGIDDIVVGSGHTGLAGRSRSGSLYIIYDSLIRNFSGRGNVVDLWAGNNAYNLVYYNATGSYFSLLGDLIIEDFNNDGKMDIIIGSGYSDNNSRADSGSLYYISGDLIDNYSGTNNQIDLANSNNFNWRIDGAGVSDLLSYNNIGADDLNNNGIKDIIIAAPFADNNSRTDSGSVYVIFDSVFSQYSTIGSTINLADNSNYSLRFDGAFAGSYLGFGMRGPKDINNDGYNDLILTASGDSNNNKINSGSVYVILNSKISAYSGNGNTVNLSNSAKYDIRYDGAAGGDSFGFSNYFDDFNDDGSIDFMISAPYADLSGKTDNGGIYIINNFPHTITATSISTPTNNTSFSVTGNVTATNSVTTISGVEYQLDSNNPSSGWTECTANDGAFDEKNEDYTCSISSLSEGAHTIYFRSYDQNTSYTAQSHYGSVTFTVDATPPSVSLSALSPDPAYDPTPSITGSATGTGSSVSSVQYQIDGTSGSWTACASDDGTFDEASEDFTCDVSPALDNGVHTIYVRAVDSAGNTTPSGQEVSDEFTVDYDIQVTESGGSTIVSEDGVTDSVEIVLLTLPSDDVVITLSLTDSADSMVALSPTSLTFTVSNWSTPQTVTVSSSNDGVVEDSGDTDTLSFSVASADTNYNTMSVAPVTINVTDHNYGDRIDTDKSGSSYNLKISAISGTSTKELEEETDPNTKNSDKKIKVIRTQRNRPTISFGLIDEDDKDVDIDKYDLQIQYTDILKRRDGSYKTWVKGIKHKTPTHPTSEIKDGFKIKYSGKPKNRVEVQPIIKELKEGTYYIRIKAYDKAGDSVTSKEVKLIIDTTPQPL